MLLPAGVGLDQHPSTGNILMALESLVLGLLPGKSDWGQLPAAAL